MIDEFGLVLFFEVNVQISVDCGELKRLKKLIFEQRHFLNVRENDFPLVEDGYRQDQANEVAGNQHQSDLGVMLGKRPTYLKGIRRCCRIK